jgi:hypothetical protein
MRLVEIHVVPSQVEATGQGETQSVDWHALFDEAGLSLENFKSVEPRQLPPAYADARAAWEGVFPAQPQMPLRVEAAAYRGKPIYFELLGSWSQPQRLQPAELDAGRTRFFATIFFVFMLVSVTGVALARRNWRLGRGDRKGAFRLAVIMFTLSLLGWLIGASHVPAFRGELRLFWFAIAEALIKAFIIWLFYSALEPYVRRRSPHRIISWSRLMAGNWRDPLVGRDILIGMLLSLGGSCRLVHRQQTHRQAIGGACRCVCAGNRVPEPEHGRLNLLRVAVLYVPPARDGLRAPPAASLPAS